MTGRKNTHTKLLTHTLSWPQTPPSKLLPLPPQSPPSPPPPPLPPQLHHRHHHHLHSPRRPLLPVSVHDGDFLTPPPSGPLSLCKANNIQGERGGRVLRDFSLHILVDLQILSQNVSPSRTLQGPASSGPSPRPGVSCQNPPLPLLSLIHI